MFLLDELLRQRGIDRDKCLGSGRADEVEDDVDEELTNEDDSIEDKSHDEKIKTLIQSTVEYLIQYNKKELLELVNEFRKDVGEDFLDTVQELEELVNVYLLEEFLEKGPIRSKIDEVRRKLEDSAIPKSKQHRLQMLLNYIAQNRYHVQFILKWLTDPESEEAFTLKQLAREELLSEEQHLELAEAQQNDNLYSSWVGVIKNTKVGQGLKFLPRKLNDLVKSLKVLVEELDETGQSEARNKVAAVLEELLRRNGISLD